MPKKSKKQSETINSKLALVFKSGKAVLGYRSCKKCLRKGKAQLIFIANNCPQIRKQEVEYLCMIMDIKMVHYQGNNTELGRLLPQLLTFQEPPAVSFTRSP